MIVGLGVKFSDAQLFGIPESDLIEKWEFKKCYVFHYAGPANAEHNYMQRVFEEPFRYLKKHNYTIVGNAFIDNHYISNTDTSNYTQYSVYIPIE